MKFFLVYTTCGNLEEARHIADTVVREKLAACANILPQMQSVYMWQGKMEQSEEAVLLLKIPVDNFEPVRARIRALHSYQTPAIFALPIEAMDKDYATWAKGVCA